eukprot:SAG11_NODE_3150_length_2646_cov_7.388300_1_plen_45_part_00
MAHVRALTACTKLQSTPTTIVMCVTRSRCVNNFDLDKRPIMLDN